MNYWALLFLLIPAGLIAGLCVLSHYTDKRKKQADEAFMAKTRICPNCYGRGRVCEEGWEWVEDDPYKLLYDKDPKALVNWYNINQAKKESKSV